MASTLRVFCLLAALLLNLNGEWFLSRIIYSHDFSFAGQAIIHLLFALYGIVFLYLSRLRFSKHGPIFTVIFATALIFAAFSSSLFQSVFYLLASMKGLLVAIGLFAVISSLGISKIEICKALVAVVGIQFTVVMFQTVFPTETFALWQPTQGLSGAARVAQSLAQWDGTAYGIFSSQIGLAYYCFVALVVSESLRVRHFASNLVAVCAGLSIFFSGSLAVLLLYVAYIGATRLGYGSASVIGSCAVMLTLTFFSGLVEIAGLPFEAYLAIAAEGRLGILIDVVPKFFTVPLTNILFGFGYQTLELYKFLISGPTPPLIFVNDLSAVALLDVFHVAVLVQFGFFGFLVYLYLYFWLAPFGKWENRNLKEGVAWLIGAAIWLGFFNQVWNMVPFAVPAILGLIVANQEEHKRRTLTA